MLSVDYNKQGINSCISFLIQIKSGLCFNKTEMKVPTQCRLQVKVLNLPSTSEKQDKNEAKLTGKQHTKYNSRKTCLCNDHEIV